MRTRITLAFIAVLALSLVIAGGVSLALLRHASNNSAKRTLLSQARALAANPKTVQLKGVLPLLTKVGGIEHDGIFTVTGPNQILGSLPNAIPQSALGGAALAKGREVSGSHGSTVFAEVPLFSTEGTTVVLWLTSTETFPDDNIWYFLLAGGISLVVAVSLALVIAQRISGRVNVAAHAAQQIAGGNFSTRMALDKRDYPEIVELSRSINAMAEDLERAQDAERQFLLSVSHDLRTPLTSIRGYSEAIVEGAVSDLPSAASVVVAETDRLERLINDLLDLARLRAKRFSFDYTAFRLETIVKSATEALPLALEDDVRLEVIVPERPVEMISDPHRIGQISANLVENALKFARATVTVKVLEIDDAHVSILVEDDGPGIPPEDLSRVFERLYTSRQEGARSTGTGIGLAIVAELTEALGGTVAAESPINDAGGGSRFCVSLPKTLTDH